MMQQKIEQNNKMDQMHNKLCSSENKLRQNSQWLFSSFLMAFEDLKPFAQMTSQRCNGQFSPAARSPLGRRYQHFPDEQRFVLGFMTKQFLMP